MVRGEGRRLERRVPVGREQAGRRRDLRVGLDPPVLVEPLADRPLITLLALDAVAAADVDDADRALAGALLAGLGDQPREQQPAAGNVLEVVAAAQLRERQRVVRGHRGKRIRGRAHAGPARPRTRPRSPTGPGRPAWRTPPAGHRGPAGGRGAGSGSAGRRPRGGRRTGAPPGPRARSRRRCSRGAAGAARRRSRRPAAGNACRSSGGSEPRAGATSPRPGPRARLGDRHVVAGQQVRRVEVVPPGIAGEVGRVEIVPAHVAAQARTAEEPRPRIEARFEHLAVEGLDPHPPVVEDGAPGRVGIGDRRAPRLADPDLEHRAAAQLPGPRVSSRSPPDWIRARTRRARSQRSRPPCASRTSSRSSLTERRSATSTSASRRAGARARRRRGAKGPDPRSGSAPRHPRSRSRSRPRRRAR